jgi:pantetheine-phosphate adenylyltransferase
MKKALFPGSFDPPTWGHIRLIERGSKLFDQIVVGVGANLAKGKGLLTSEERVEGLAQELKGLSNVEVLPFTGLTVDFAKEIGASVLLRGLRSPSDLEKELEMARANCTIQQIETLFLAGEEETANISSSLIRELAANGAPLEKFIPKQFIKMIDQKKRELWNEE